MLVLRRTSPVRLSRTKGPRLVRRIWEPSLPVPVPVAGCGRVRDVFVVDDQEPAGGVLAVGGTSWRSRQGVVDPWMELSPADPFPRRTPPPPAGRPARLNASWEFMLHGRVPSQGWVADRWRTGCRSATAPGSGDGVRPPVGVGQQLHQVWRWWAWV